MIKQGRGIQGCGSYTHTHTTRTLLAHVDWQGHSQLCIDISLRIGPWRAPFGRSEAADPLSVVLQHLTCLLTCACIHTSRTCAHPSMHLCACVSLHLCCVCRGDASSAVAALSMVPLLPGNGVSDLFTNRVFLAGFWAWFTAQTLKVRANKVNCFTAHTHPEHIDRELWQQVKHSLNAHSFTDSLAQLLCGWSSAAVMSVTKLDVPGVTWLYHYE